MEYDLPLPVDPSHFDPVTAQVLGKLKCLICSSHASGFHFDAQSCSACAAFFRRTVVLKKAYQCTNKEFPNQCNINYKSKLCRACRFRRCLESGMDRNSVQPQKSTEQKQRNYFTASGLKRNKRFAVPEVRAALKRKLCDSQSSPHHTISPPLSVSVPSPEGTHISSVPSPEAPSPWTNLNTPSTSSPVDATSPKFSFDSYQHPEEQQLPYQQQLPYYYQRNNVLLSLVNEELRTAERRRIAFCNGDANRMFQPGQNAYTLEDIKPLSFKAYRESIRIHILFVLEWLRAWPEFQYLRTEDQMTFLRKCVLYHIVLDPVLLTIQVGDYTKFIMQNGGYVSTTDMGTDGWEDEEEITGATKRTIYWPLLHRVLNEILNPIVQMGLTYEEIVALKGFVCYRGTQGDIHRSGHGFIRDRLDQLNCALAQYYQAQNLPGDRMGQVILLSSSVLEVSHDFVLGHHQVDFFKLWGLDSLLVQMLHHYGKH
ncbi:hypothetical protein QR680_015207 [Steinernema hermaphroditum]|uniref:Nuclear receptor domain-containing protein n=1 Tax=Steinernema hermaphroditum TaxID=289476 RepID=A0AA39IDU1_9BILA|nr:hypothetical protein QR680_015207 [Steinernema hermaphroditum]